MKFMLKTDRQPVVGNINSVRGLYESYSAMLLGYMLEVVKDRKLAEECMVQLFCDISQNFDARDWESGNSWCRLQRLAQRKLNTFTSAFSQCKPTTLGVTMSFAQNNYLKLLNDEQRQVFCAIYYHRKPVSEVSKELNITEDLTRKTLKEAFAIMRDGGKN